MFSKYNTLDTFKMEGTTYHYYNINKLINDGFNIITEMPFTIRIILESLLRQNDGNIISATHIEHILNWQKNINKESVPFKPSRIILQDLSGIPSLIDIASIRNKLNRKGIDSKFINPKIPVDLIVDHSVQVDSYGNSTSFNKNMTLEFERNKERYEFLQWAKNAFDNFRLVPPATGIIHQINLEYLSTIIQTKKLNREMKIAYPDTLLGTDSHTTMINSLGVLGWGVGGLKQNHQC